MAAETAKQVQLLEATTGTLMSVFTRGGFEPVAPAIIQPAGVFLDVVGETLRARTYVFTDPDGDELCLRPDLTVPACRLHLERDPTGATSARYSYNGPAFRFQPQGVDLSHPREFRQTGIESFGEEDREQAEAQVVGTIIRALEATGLTSFTLRFGDLGLLRALLKAADMPARWRQRLMHLFWNPVAFKAELHRLTTDPGSRSQTIPKPLRDALDPERSIDSEATVAGYLDSKGVDLVGVRTTAEVSGMLLGRVADAASEPLSPKTAQLIASYVAIQSPARAAVKRLADLAALMEVDLTDAIATYERRLNLFEQAGIDVDRAEFSADFGRALEYYTGFVFEVITPELGRKSPVVGGGRYDDLMKTAGAPRNIPAVGAAVHSERLVTALSASSSKHGPSVASPAVVSGFANGEEKPATDKLILAVPSKGRLMEQAAEFFAASNMVLRKTGNERGYRGELVDFADVDVSFVSASEIAWYLKTGKAHFGITGEDLVREQMSDADERVMFLKRLGFGHADVVVAVPEFWLDVRTMDDLDDMALSFRRAHGRWYRVATKYLNITRRFFAAKGVTDYRIVESLGATEGTPSAGSAELIVDITSTGATLKANGLRILDDGIILRSEANLVASKVAAWTPRALEARSLITRKLGL